MAEFELKSQPMRRSLRRRTKSEADNECAKALLDLAMSNLPTNDITKIKVDLKIRPIKSRTSKSRGNYSQIHIAKRRLLLKPVPSDTLSHQQQVISNRIQNEHNYTTFIYSRYQQYQASIRQNHTKNPKRTSIANNRPSTLKYAKTVKRRITKKRNLLPVNIVASKESVVVPKREEPSETKHSKHIGLPTLQEKITIEGPEITVDNDDPPSTCTVTPSLPIATDSSVLATRLDQVLPVLLQCQIIASEDYEEIESSDCDVEDISRGHDIGNTAACEMCYDIVPKRELRSMKRVSEPWLKRRRYDPSSGLEAILGH